jgi:hypothetical protein
MKIELLTIEAGAVDRVSVPAGLYGGPGQLPFPRITARPDIAPGRTPGTVQPVARLEYLRGELRAERISWGELAELQSLAEYIPAEDVELREAAGLPEFPAEPLGVAGAIAEIQKRNAPAPLTGNARADEIIRAQFVKNKRRTVTRNLLACWASYLINGDASGIDPRDKADADAYLKKEGLPAPVSCEPYGFGRPDCGGLAGDLETFAFILEPVPGRRVRCNVWGNWYGYEGTRRAAEFGTDEETAEDWRHGLTVAPCFLIDN